MSFNDLERGTYTPLSQSSGASLSNEERTYKKAVQGLSQKIFRINASVANIRQLVGQLGTSRDTPRLRQDIHSKMEETRDLVKTTSTELKSLSEFQRDESKRRARRLEQQKLTADFQKTLEQFQAIQRVSAEISREYVDMAKHAVQAQTEYEHNDDDDDGEANPLLGQQRRVQLSVLDNDVEYNEALINERESEIHEIEQGIVELNEIFRDLGTIVTEQQSLLDNIETNVQSVAVNVLGASEELNTASEYQRRSNKTKCCILLFAVIFFLVILLIALS
ncbi:t-SNARE [Martensiomyces pterosporus]|nr:t-SNARE [Martensiomyces pterosporus]